MIDRKDPLNLHLFVYEELLKEKENTDELSTQPEIVRCKDCVIHKVCRYTLGLGENGFCSQGMRKEDG